jgi:hypothetical protein
VFADLFARRHIEADFSLVFGWAAFVVKPMLSRARIATRRAAPPVIKTRWGTPHSCTCGHGGRDRLRTNRGVHDAEHAVR